MELYPLLGSWLGFLEAPWFEWSNRGVNTKSLTLDPNGDQSRAVRVANFHSSDAARKDWVLPPLPGGLFFLFSATIYC